MFFFGPRGGEDHPPLQEELGKRGLKSLIPEEAYTVKGYEWDYGGEK